ncbi:MAG: hypothetical protein MJZ30_05875 [Paludibacteraceae bacterium]|nr:hypothetical protein [Paludibacteraceae bacterium]
MTRQEFESLKVGDYVIHGFGHVGRIVKLDNGGYIARDPSFNPKDKFAWDVSFAWNEGSPLQDYNDKEIPMSLSEPIRKAYKNWGVPRKRRAL